MPAAYREDLAFIHAAGFGDFARAAAPRLIARLRRAGVRRGTVVELGCGAGAATRALLAAGYRVEGLDASSEMLRLARRAAPGAKLRRARLPRARLPACDAAVAVGEVVNYLSRPEDFDELFRRVFAALRPGGIFLFDARLPASDRRPRAAGRAGRGWAVVAESVEKGGVLTRRIAAFRREGGAYRRSDEVHVQRLLSAAELSRRLRAAGLRVRVFALGPAHVLVEAGRPSRP
jgi:SAM-dependent methyltransferase